MGTYQYRYQVRNLKSDIPNYWICGIKSGASEGDVIETLKEQFRKSHNFELSSTDIRLVDLSEATLDGSKPEYAIIDEEITGDL